MILTFDHLITDILHCIALEEAVRILRLQRLLILHRSEPPGIVNDAAKSHTCEVKNRIKPSDQRGMINKSGEHIFSSGVTLLPVVLFGLVVKLLQH